MEYVALIDFQDSATGFFIEKGSKYPPGVRVVQDKRLEYLSGSENKCRKPVIKAVGVVENPFKDVPTVTQGDDKPETSEPKEEAPDIPILDTPVTPPKEEHKDGEAKQFPDLSKDGLVSAFKVLSAGKGSAPRAKASMLKFLKGDTWLGGEPGPKIELLSILGEKNVPNDKVDSVLEKTLKAAINEVFGG